MAKIRIEYEVPDGDTCEGCSHIDRFTNRCVLFNFHRARCRVWTDDICNESFYTKCHNCTAATVKEEVK